MKETQVAQVLGVTQSAVSKYNKKVRGTTVPIYNMPEIRKLADQMITLLLANPPQQLEVTKLFCQASKLIKDKDLMCSLCQQNQNQKIENCDFCRTL